MQGRGGWVAAGAVALWACGTMTLQAATAATTRAQVQAKIQAIVANERQLAQELAVVKSELEIIKVRATSKKKS